MATESAETMIYKLDKSLEKITFSFISPEKEELYLHIRYALRLRRETKEIRGIVVVDTSQWFVPSASLDP